MLGDFLHDYKNTFNGSILVLVKRYFFLTFYGILKYLPTPIGDVLRAGYLKFFLKQLDTFFIREGVTFHFPENISIGKSVVSEFVYFNGYGGIKIGDRVLIGAGTKFFSHDHDFSDLTKPIWHQGLIKKPVVVGDNVFIGCNATILGDVTIGEGVVIGAGSVVTSCVPSNSIVAGVPAKVIGMRTEDKRQKSLASSF